jgi:predicted DNA-binding transcriptional regulator AlpA
VTIDELRAPFGLSRWTIYQYVKRGILPPATGTGRGAHWTNAHREALAAWMALRHNNVSGSQAVAFCKEEGISLPDFLKQREASIRTFGIGIA